MSECLIERVGKTPLFPSLILSRATGSTISLKPRKEESKRKETLL